MNWDGQGLFTLKSERQVDFIGGESSVSTMTPTHDDFFVSPDGLPLTVNITEQQRQGNVKVLLTVATMHHVGHGHQVPNGYDLPLIAVDAIMLFGLPQVIETLLEVFTHVIADGQTIGSVSIAGGDDDENAHFKVVEHQRDVRYLMCIKINCKFGGSFIVQLELGDGTNALLIGMADEAFFKREE